MDIKSDAEPQQNFTDDIPESDFDNDFFQRVVADAGRWAYGVVFVEVWVMNEERTQLERPQGGFWVDPVSCDYGQNTKFQRLIDPTRDDYFQPIPQAPGVGIPGALWSQATRGNVAVDSSSIRSGTIFGGKDRSMRGHRRNRTLFPFDTTRGGTIFGNTPDSDDVQSFPTTKNALEDDPSTPGRTDCGASEARRVSHQFRHRRSASMDDSAATAAKRATSPS